MPIRISDVNKDEIVSKGGVAIDTGFTGEISGTLASGLKLASMRGTPVSDDTIQEYEGYLKIGDELVPTRLVSQTLNTTAGTVKGNFDAGLNLKSIYGSSLVDSEAFSEDGQGIVYQGGELRAVQLNPHRILALESGEINTQNGDVIFVDCTLSTTIALNPTPSKWDFIKINVIAGDPSLHPITLGGSHDVGGDTNTYQHNRKQSVYVVFNGLKWEVVL